MRHFYVILLFLTACSSGTNTTHTQDSKEKIKNVKPASLISWSKEFVMVRDENDFSYFNDHENFIKEYFSVKYLEERIVATTLMEMDCVDSIVGSIEISNDTIFLKQDLIMTDGRLCSGFHKFTYTISNPENIRYKVVSTK